MPERGRKYTPRSYEGEGESEPIWAGAGAPERPVFGRMHRVRGRKSNAVQLG